MLHADVKQLVQIQQAKPDDLESQISKMREAVEVIRKTVLEIIESLPGNKNRFTKL
jgi:hypothetical protein